MIRVLHGEDEYARSEALVKIRESTGPAEVRDPNTTVFEGRGFNLNDVIGAAQFVPFMADRRVVIVYGVLGRMQKRDKSLGNEWRELTAKLSEIPATTELVFVEEVSLRDNGLALKSVGPSARIQQYRTMRRPELEIWVRDRFAFYGAETNRDAVARITWLAGTDTRLLDQEIKKLALYAGDREVTPEDVDLMVPDAREANIFAAVDAVLERRPAVAMKLLYSLLSGGSSVQSILSMLARQVRLLILTIELQQQGVQSEELGKRIGLTNRYALDKTLRQSQSFGTDHLANILRRLLAADLAIKQGEIDERLAVEILVGELSAA
ncbi:MAG: DNA polymerase III subunit delta [Chloroflexi bacterium]|jgi:DNA polymerase-3 subunit delta|nr:DNA polymerase III subunit delta [Chloroflexota bacterium]MBT3862707.1 DNA polymerase III subunit delta [Chloroflexota bacterium]MBT4141570.1 DNA polymerase III subunit delta [Chloroflexota bacterium]MBT4342255.1 DNA polymerase III subunit delta [Chloroflexota bacterium]MBT4943183.1 DNA polymerase III subunit delta [Chloroflexota bacterium]